MLFKAKRDLGSSRQWRHFEIPVAFEVLPRESREPLASSPLLGVTVLEVVRVQDGRNKWVTVFSDDQRLEW